MNRFLVLCLAVLICLTFSVDAHSQCGPYLNFVPPGGPVLVCPMGDAGKFAGFGIFVLDFANNPIPNIPRCDFWVIDCDPVNDMVLCSGSQSSNALFDTDVNGSTRFNGPVSAGGCAEGLAVVVQGFVIQDPATACTTAHCLSYQVRSPDINGDLFVDLIDLSLFASAWSGLYDPCQDFDDDGVIGLVDLSLFAAHFGHTCAVEPCP